jgi:hypothetical protein
VARSPVTFVGWAMGCRHGRSVKAGEPTQTLHLVVQGRTEKRVWCGAKILWTTSPDPRRDRPICKQCARGARKVVPVVGPLTQEDVTLLLAALDCWAEDIRDCERDGNGCGCDRNLPDIAELTARLGVLSGP